MTQLPELGSDPSLIQIWMSPGPAPPSSFITGSRHADKQCFLNRCKDVLFFSADHSNRMKYTAKTNPCIPVHNKQQAPRLICSAMLLSRTKDSAGDTAESCRGLYWCNDCKRCGTLCFDLLAPAQCNCSHSWKVHIGHSPILIFLQLNGWLCLTVKKWAILLALASCLIVPNLYFIKMMTHCTPSPSLYSCSIDL